MVTHVDFQEVRLDEPIEAEVAVIFEGRRRDIKMGGVLDVLVREVTVKALPMEMPEHLVLDITHLGIGESAKVGDVHVPEGVEILGDLDEVICSILPPRKAEVAPEAAEEAAEAPAAEAEPEIVGKAEGAAD